MSSQLTGAMSGTSESPIALQAAGSLRPKEQSHFGCRVFALSRPQEDDQNKRTQFTSPGLGEHRTDCSPNSRTVADVSCPELLNLGLYSSFEILSRTNMIILTSIRRFCMKVDRCTIVSAPDKMRCRSSIQRTLLIEHHGSPTKIRSLSGVPTCVPEDPLSFLRWSKTFSPSLRINRQRPFANPTIAAKRFGRSWLRGY
jgi:hypothetical protein